MPSKATIDAIHQFLANFRYVDNKGKRAKTNLVQTLFSNKKLTTALEKNAIDLETKLHDLLRSNLSQEQLLAKFKEYVSNAYAEAVKQRDALAPTNFVTVTNTIPPISAFYISMYEPHEVTYYDSHKPYAAGKFEKELIAGLTAAKKLFGDDGKVFCEIKINEISSYDPKERRTNVQTHHTGSFMSPQL